MRSKCSASWSHQMLKNYYNTEQNACIWMFLDVIEHGILETNWHIKLLILPQLHQWYRYLDLQDSITLLSVYTLVSIDWRCDMKNLSYDKKSFLNSNNILWHDGKKIFLWACGDQRLLNRSVKIAFVSIRAEVTTQLDYVISKSNCL